MSAITAITNANWGQAPYNRISFQQVQRLFPTCRLKRDINTTHEWPQAEQVLGKISFTAADGSQQSVDQLIERSFTDAFAVLHRGKLINEQYFNGMAVDSHHLLNSVTKSFVGMLAGIAVEKGQLDPEQPAIHYLPELTNSAWSDCTVRHLLDMTAGAAYLEDYADPQTDFWHEAAVVGWRPALVDDQTPATLLEYACSLEGKDQQNGEKFHYRTVTTNLVGMVLEQAMDKPLSELLEQLIWSRMGTRNDASIVVDAVGFPYVGAGMSACTRDLLSFGQMMIDGGRSHGQQLIPKSWIEDTLRGDASSKKCFSDSDYGEALAGWHYRNQVWIKDGTQGVMLALGIHGQTIYMDRSKELVIVKLSSQPESVDLEMYLDTFAAMDAISASL